MGFSRVLPLLIGALSLFSNIAENVDDDDGRSSGDMEIDMNDSNVSSTLPNFGQKTNEDQRYWYEHLDDADRMLKSKADILSHLLKVHIDRLRNKTDQVDKTNVAFLLFALTKKESVRCRDLSSSNRESSDFNSNRRFGIRWNWCSWWTRPARSARRTSAAS